MKEQLVSFETAKLAKEKGFDWECHSYYHILDVYEAQDVKYDKLKYNSQADNWHRSVYSDNYWSAPTQSFLQKWLREEHDIHTVIEPKITMDHCYKYTLILYKHACEPETIWEPHKEGLDILESKRFSSYNTYEEVSEAGLLESLKIIEV